MKYLDNKIKIFTFLLIVCGVVFFVQKSNGDLMTQKDTFNNTVMEQVNTIDLKTGCNEKEAILIAQAFMIEQGFRFNDINIRRAEVVQSKIDLSTWSVEEEQQTSYADFA